jgi:hypothetical protein
MSEAESAEQCDPKPPIKQGRKPLFLLSIKPGESFEHFKERVVATAHEAGFLKRSRTSAREGVTGMPGGVFATRENDVKHGFRKFPRNRNCYSELLIQRFAIEADAFGLRAVSAVLTPSRGKKG